LYPDATSFWTAEDEVEGGISPLRRLYSETASVDDIELSGLSVSAALERGVMVRMSSAFIFRSLIPVSRTRRESGTGIVTYIGIMSPIL
jgi:hypothetical protein